MNNRDTLKWHNFTVKVEERLDKMERTIDVVRGKTCNCEVHERCEYEGSWHCEFHGQQRNDFSWRKDE
jgi:hypothetical protein